MYQIQFQQFRQLVLKELSNYGETCKCINCREIKDNPSNPKKAILKVEEYDASEGREFFISYNTEDINIWIYKIKI